jgi:RND family efflux transporter MFP subunit
MMAAGCGHGAGAETVKKADKPELPVIKAAVLTIESRKWPAIVRTQGSLIADEVTVVGAKVAGRVAEVHVDLGDLVSSGAPLAMLDQDEFRLQISLSQAQLMQSRAALGLKPEEPVENLDAYQSPPVREARAVWEESRTKIDRVRQLRVRNAATQDELEQAISAEGVAEARYASAVNAVRERIAQIVVRAAELSLAQQRLADTVIHAPFDGLVQERHVARGSFVQVGDSIITFVRTGRLRFRGMMPERHAHRLALGEQLTLRIEGVVQPRPATITRISPSVDEMSRSLVFEAQVENPDGVLRTGLFAEAEVVVDPNARAVVVPQSAVLEFAGAEKVWKVVDGVSREQTVQTVHRSPDEVEIVRGLAEGDQILRDATRGRVARIEPVADENSAATAPTIPTSIEGAAEEESGASASESTVPPAQVSPSHNTER